ncbi:MAG: hypothetical protein N2039_09920 [Gemmataceae bacterium]|nr:hypothetical protein [Gemmataceae bacterium]
MRNRRGMPGESDRDSFPPQVPLEEVAASLLSALWTTQSLHGNSRVRLDAAHRLDRPRRTYVIDRSGPQPVEMTA